MSNKIALSFDIEDWYHTPYWTQNADSKYKSIENFHNVYKGRYDYITESVSRILELLNKYNVQATFFMVGDVCQYYPELTKAIAESPHEVACHDLHHYIVYDSKNQKMLFTIEEFEKSIKQAKEIIENATGKEIIGYRAPGGWINQKMMGVIAEQGFKYDSSISFNSVYSKNPEFSQKATTVPFFINDKILEMPWTYYSFAGIKIPTAGAFFLRVLGNKIISAGLKQALKKGDTMLYLHPMDIYGGELPVKTTNGRGSWYWKNRGEKTEKHLIKLLEKYQDKFTTCKEIYLKAKK